MGDHWKSLAQKLGAPGMDDPTTSSNESASPTESAAFTREPEFSKEPEYAREPELTQPVEPLSEVMTPAPEPEVVDEKPRKRSSWEALASMFNIQIDRSSAEPPAPAQVKPPAPAPAPPRERESRPAAQREKPRFNEPRREREPARDRETRDREPEPRLQVFQESPEVDTNPALESLFADAPRGDLDSWKKPPRVVDDIGWGEEVPVSSSEDVDEDFDSGSFAPESKTDAENAPESTDRPRRRRRRRGPRRPEGAEGNAPRKDLDVDDVESVVPGDDYSEPESFEADLSEVSDSSVQADPERRSSRRRRRGRKRPVDDAAAPAHHDDGELNAELASERPGDRPERMPDRGPRPERISGRSDRNPERSSERPPQSRPRSSESSTDRSAPRGNERGPERSTERVSERGSGRPSERGVERSEQSADRGVDRGDRPARAERGPDSRGPDSRGPDTRREKRTERPEPRADRPPRVREERPLPPRSDVEEHDDADLLEDIDSEDSGEKHRNIPSWADSLQAIIEGNMENHKRNDNNRGGPPRGRPRSRR